MLAHARLGHFQIKRVLKTEKTVFLSAHLANGNKAKNTNFYHFYNKILQNIQKTQKGDFDQRLECAAHKFWSKYTTLSKVTL